MENVIVSIFSVESEAYQAFTELRQAPQGEGYIAGEAALLKNADGKTTIEDSFTLRDADTGSANGIVIGALAGILGGPLGVLLGASYGALVGSSVDAAAAMDNMSAVEVLAGKIYEGEVAIVALVQEEEPAFDAAFAKYQTSMIRYDAADIIDEVERAYEIQAEENKKVLEQLRAERKADRAERREERRAALKADFEQYSEKAAGWMGAN